MLPKSNRLVLSKRNPEKLANKVENGQFTIRFRKTASDFKAAVVVSKATAKKAVDRNRIRRITTEALKTLQITGLDLIVVVKENINDQKPDQVAKSLKGVLSKI